jgi:hypothetical protein
MSYRKRHPINNSQAEEADEEVAGLVSKLMGDDEEGEAQGPNPARAQRGFLFTSH